MDAPVYRTVVGNGRASADNTDHAAAAEQRRQHKAEQGNGD